MKQRETITKTESKYKEIKPHSGSTCLKTHFGLTFLDNTQRKMKINIPWNALANVKR